MFVSHCLHLAHNFSSVLSVLYLYMISGAVKSSTLDSMTWIFTESGHGKGPADGVGSSVKKTIDDLCAYSPNTVINCAQHVLERWPASSTIQIHHYTTTAVEEAKSSLPSNFKLKSKPFGLGKCHEFSVTEDDIQMKMLSDDKSSIKAMFQYDHVNELGEVQEQDLPQIETVDQPAVQDLPLVESNLEETVIKIKERGWYVVKFSDGKTIKHYVAQLLRSNDAEDEDGESIFTVQSYVTIPLKNRKEYKMYRNEEDILGSQIVARLRRPPEIIGSMKIKITDTTVVDKFNVK